MNRKFVSLSIVGLALSGALFWFSSQDHSGESRQLVAPNEPQHVLPQQSFNYKSDPALKKLHDKLLRLTARKLEKGFMRKALPTGLPTKADSWGQLPDSAITYETFAEMPETLQLACLKSLVKRIGQPAFSKLDFVKAIHLNPPKPGVHLDAFSRELPRPVSYLATFAINDPVPGVRLYEGQLAFDEDLQLIDSDIPNMRGGFSSDNFLSVNEVLEIGAKQGFVLLHIGSVHFINGTLIIRLQTLPHIDETGEDPKQRFSVASFDLQTGRMVGEPRQSHKTHRHYDNYNRKK